MALHSPLREAFQHCLHSQIASNPSPDFSDPTACRSSFSSSRGRTHEALRQWRCILSRGKKPLGRLRELDGGVHRRALAGIAEGGHKGGGIPAKHRMFAKQSIVPSKTKRGTLTSNSVEAYKSRRVTPSKKPTLVSSPAKPFCATQPSLRRQVDASAALQAGWNVFLPQQYTYSMELKDLDPQQLSDLWERTLGERRSPHKCALAMKKSYAFVLVIVKEQHTDLSPWRQSTVNPGTRIIGVARAISDGEFMATVCDVAVDPDYTGRGIGRKVVQTLVRNMKLRGPTGFAAFPPPKARRFFFMMGFRIDKKYRLMSYEGKGEFPDLRDEQAKLKGANREGQGNVTGSQPGFEPESS